MQNVSIHDWTESSYLTKINQAYIEQMYIELLENPVSSIDDSWIMIFKDLFSKESHSHLNVYNKLIEQNTKKGNKNNFTEETIHYYNLSNNIQIQDVKIKVFQMIHYFRSMGHKCAQLDPLCLQEQNKLNVLDWKFYKFSKNDLQLRLYLNNVFNDNEFYTLKNVYDLFKKIYCSKIGFEYIHINNYEEKTWIENKIESINKQPIFNPEEKIQFLKELISAEEIEKYLGIKFPGSKRFSLEGCDVLIPMLKEIIRYSNAKNNIKKIILGMAHRGRLNVLTNILGKKTSALFNEFANSYKPCSGSGDVKYHQGFSTDLEIQNNILHIILMFNPSHLEIISPVVMGSVRALIDQSNNKQLILPITIHGDAAISGQGIVQESLNMSKICSYDVGGTIRIIINNQIGFTTSNINNMRSTYYCSDIAKMLQIPIFHVNADDVESVIFITRLALDFRNKFHKDVLIDLVCYRRHGHNEVDEPSVTQPIMYKNIKQHPTVCTIYTNVLKQQDIIQAIDRKKMTDAFIKKLDAGTSVLQEVKRINKNIFLHYQSKTHDVCNEIYEDNIYLEQLKKLAICTNTIPKTINMHDRVNKIYNDRLDMAHGKKLFDWGGAELLAYATLLNKGINIRLSGEDSARGTFFHRHAIVYDQNNGSMYIPLSNIHEKQGIFTVWDSMLSEEAVLAFEYGYSIANKYNLVIWEAQFGDFANGAQIVIDQFISSGEQKWGQKSGLIMLLPHGYEGQGPEHSSARMERYLQLCAENNMRICVPTTPSQLYNILTCHLFYKQLTPLIIFSPKSLLRHPMVKSSLKDLALGNFQPFIGEVDHNINPLNVTKLIICSGKVYYDLLQQRLNNKQINVIILRVELLYPLPVKDINNALMLYPNVKEYIWCQEEPINQGPWKYIKYHFDILFKNIKFIYIGRSELASPAVGSLFIHNMQQKKIIHDALNCN